MKEIVESGFRVGDVLIYEHEDYQFLCDCFLNKGYVVMAKADSEGWDVISVNELLVKAKEPSLDKEIAAMEKQPEYEYMEVDAGESWSVWEYLKAYEDMECDWYVIYGDNYRALIEWFNVCEAIRKGEQLYRRVEITPEQKREREVEGLAREMHEADVKRGEFSVASEWDAIEVWEENSYISHAKKAIEWMESKK